MNHKHPSVWWARFTLLESPNSYSMSERNNDTVSMLRHPASDGQGTQGGFPSRNSHRSKPVPQARLQGNRARWSRSGPAGMSQPNQKIGTQNDTNYLVVTSWRYFATKDLSHQPFINVEPEGNFQQKAWSNTWGEKLWPASFARTLLEKLIFPSFLRNRVALRSTRFVKSSEIIQHTCWYLIHGPWNSWDSK